MRLLTPSRALAAMAVVFALAATASARQRPSQSHMFHKFMMSNTSMPFVAGRKDRRSGFLSFDADDPQPFEPLAGLRPERICDRLDEADFANLGWRRAEIITAGWECVSVTATAAGGLDEDTNANSLFYMLRGRGGQRMSSARLKISVPRLETRAATAARAAELLTLLGESIEVETPAAFLEAARNLTPLQFATPQAIYSLRQEYGDQPRYNLFVEFGLPRNVFVQGAYRERIGKDASRDPLPAGFASQKKDRLHKAR